MLWCVAARITPARQAQRAGSFGVRCCCCWMALLAGDVDWPLIEFDGTHKNLLPTISFRQRFCAIERRRMASHSRETTHHQRRPTSHEMCACCYVTGLRSGQIASSLTPRLLFLFSHDIDDALCSHFAQGQHFIGNNTPAIHLNAETTLKRTAACIKTRSEMNEKVFRRLTASLGNSGTSRRRDEWNFPRLLPRSAPKYRPTDSDIYPTLSTII